MVLAHRNGNKIGTFETAETVVKDCLNDAAEIVFKIHKRLDGHECAFWDDIKNFKLIWCKEWNVWFDTKVDIDEADETVKTVFCTRLGHAELSQIMLFDTEINTENDIARDDYDIPSVIYNPENPKASTLHRILEKAPNYKVIHVDNTLKDIQRTFSFDGTSIYDALLQISNEIKCLFLFPSNSDENGNIQRTIEVYDLETNCNSCGHRSEFTGICPECGSTNLNEGYGNDTSIFVTADKLANDIQFTTDTPSVKNCMKLEGGDDLFTATIRNCNPNGSDYIWYISDEQKSDMSSELVSKLEAYDKLYAYYQSEHSASINSSMLSQYNTLVAKYKTYNKNLESLSNPLVGYPSLMAAYYNSIDLLIYLKSTLMPDVTISSTSATDQVNLLTAIALSPVSVADVSNISASTAKNAVVSMAKVLIDSRYKVDATTSTLSGQTWTGKFTVTNYSDETDTAVSNSISILIDDDYANFTLQKIQKSINKNEMDDLSILGLFSMTLGDFRAELKKYCLDSLNHLWDCAQGCIDVLIEQGISDTDTWAGSDPNLYDDLYLPYYNKLMAIEEEITLRESEIIFIEGKYDDEGHLITEGFQNHIISIREDIQKSLDFEKYLGNSLWLEFCNYRREDKYSNSNYISDSLNNAELINKAMEFIENANKELYKSAELQHTISASLKNLLLMPEFQPLLDHFEVGNWLRIRIDDSVYKLRLLEYEIDYNNHENISVEFSDITKIANGISDLESILSQASNMATSYDAVTRQAEQGAKSNNILSDWVERGLDATNTRIIGGADNQTQTWDEHGMLFKKYDALTDSYSDTQLKIINSTMAITTDKWRTVKTAVGNFLYYDPLTHQLTNAYGINAEVLVGKLILGEQLGIYNTGSTLEFNRDGLKITNGTNSFVVNPNSDILLSLSNGKENIFYVDKNGLLHISGDGAGLDISANDVINNMSSKITQTAEQISQEVIRATSKETELDNKIISTESTLSSKITQTAEAITQEVNKVATSVTTETTRAKNAESELSTKITKTEETLSSKITQTAESITQEVNKVATSVTTETTRAQNAESALGTRITTTEENLSSKITQTASSITQEVNNVSKSVAEEVTRAKGAESTLDTKITTTEQNLSTKITQTAESITQEVTKVSIAVSQEATRAKNAESDLSTKITTTETNLSSKITQTAEQITQEVTRATKAEAELSTKITQTAESIELKVSKGDISNQLSLETSGISIKGTRLTIETTNFTLTATGKVTCSDINITGGTIKVGNFSITADGLIKVTTERGVLMHEVQGSLLLGCKDQFTSHNIYGGVSIKQYNSSSVYLLVEGFANFDGYVRCSKLYEQSERSSKHSISTLDQQKSKSLIMGLNPISYQLKDDILDQTYEGFIAEEVKELEEKIFGKESYHFYAETEQIIEPPVADRNGIITKEAVTEKHASISYTALIAPIVSVVQSQQHELEILRNQISCIQKLLYN